MPITSADQIRSRHTLDAVDDLAALIRPNWDMLDSTWGSLSCTEIEAFAQVFRAAGYTDFAATMIEGHAMHDEEGDEHYTPQAAQ